MKKVIIIVLLLSSYWSFGQITYATGSYTGDDAATQAISGLGFSPDAIIVKADGAYASWVTTSTMDAGDARDLSSSSGGCTTGMINSIDADGFTVGTDDRANKSGITYHWVAMLSAGNCHVGTYTGTGADISIDAPGFQPEFVMLIQDWTDWQNVGVVYAYGSIQTTEYTYRDGNSNGDYFDGADAAGFNADATRGSYSGGVYHYIALNDDGTSFDYSTYVGNNADDRTITVSMDVDFVWVEKGTAGIAPCYKFASLAGDASFQSSANAAAAANKIQSLTATGFTVGDNVNINDNTVTYNVFAFGASVLPVDLISFNGAVTEDGYSHLTWATASEKNADYFEVERSINGKNFEVIASMSCAGNSSDIIEYEFYDYAPMPGNNYYRLRQTDYDGKFEVFDVVVVNTESNYQFKTVNVSPNPATDAARLSFNCKGGGVGKMKIYNNAGMVVNTSTVFMIDGSNEFNLDVSKYLPGMYTVQYTLPDQSVVTTKLYVK